MCGLAGYWTTASRPAGWHADAIQAMTDVLSRRGPDGEGTWLDAELGFGLGHRRLAIQDTSEAGFQPMVSSSGRMVLAYNGELYGFDSLKSELTAAGTVFRGHSDTEVLLAAIEYWGVPKTLQKINGMFAFAVWDRSTQRLTLARDRLGIKPLYYGWRGSDFLFGSELKALRALPGFQRQLNQRAVCEFLKVGYIPAPFSIESGIQKLLPGHWLEVRDPQEPVEPQGYWSMVEDAYLPGLQQPSSGGQKESLAEKTDRLEELLREVVQQHLISDVPLGAFLSGGIDSSLVVAMMQQVGGQRVRTFSMGFEIPEYNESDYARQVADHLGTEHYQQIVTAKDAQQVIPQLSEVYDEPFADSSQIPTLLVSQFARQHVTVTLSGDGGDEFFGGYRRYPYFHHLWQRLQRIPVVVRRSAGWALGKGAAVLSGRRQDSVRWRAQLLGIPDFVSCYERINRHWKIPEHLLTGDFLKLVGPTESCHDISPFCLMPDQFANQFSNDDIGAQFDWMMLHDGLRYLPDDILTKVDRASMAHGLETRVPLLDHRIVEASWGLSRCWRQGDNPTDQQQTGKVILRELLSRYVPRALFERPKVGFGVPLEHWLRNELRDWAENLLDARRLREQGIFRVAPLRRVWELHRDGMVDQQYLLWDVLMFQASCE